MISLLIALEACFILKLSGHAFEIYTFHIYVDTCAVSLAVHYTMDKMYLQN